MRHRRTAIIKLLVQKDAMTPEQAEQFVNEVVSPIIFVDGDPRASVVLQQQGSIPNELITAGELVMQNVRESMGFSRNQMGESQPPRSHSQTTAAETLIVKAASEIRVDERRDIIADLLVDLIEQVHDVIFTHWGPEQVVDLVGPGGATIWVKFSGELLNTGRYQIKIDPDSAIPLTRQLREQKAIQTYTILKTNPLVDPEKLTQYFLHELHGTQFDDMMRALPPPPNTPNGPVSPEEFGKITRDSTEQTNGAGREQLAERFLQAAISTGNGAIPAGAQ